MAHVLDVGRGVDAIVFTGYYHKAANADYLRELGVEVPYADDYARRKGDARRPRRPSGRRVAPVGDRHTAVPQDIHLVLSVPTLAVTALHAVTALARRLPVRSE
jgi:hypothetical protein